MNIYLKEIEVKVDPHNKKCKIDTKPKTDQSVLDIGLEYLVLVDSS